MADAPNPSTGLGHGVLTCPQCGGPLPLPGSGPFVTCEYCGVRTNVSTLLPPRPESPPEVGGPPPGPLSQDSTEDDLESANRRYAIPAVIAIVVMVIVLVLVLSSSSQPPTNATPSSVAHCSVNIGSTATSGPAPFTGKFTAQIATPSGVSTGTPMWQFGPFGPGLDYNFTYGSVVTHTWNSSGSYGVHVSVPDSTGQGCWNTTIIDVT